MHLYPPLDEYELAPTNSGIWSLDPTTGDLFTRIHDTMPANDPGSLGGKTVSDIEAFIFQANGFPAGTAPLPSDPQLMTGTKILGTKPAG